MRWRWLGFLLAVATLAGCRNTDGGSGGGIDAGGNDGGGGDSDTTIYAIQMGQVPVDTPVRVKGVVVTAIDTYGGRVGNVYVAEPDGGPYSGILIFNPMVDGGVSSLAVGDIVDVEGGKVSEFTLETGTCERPSDCTMTEIVAAGGALTVTKTQSGAPPVPTVVDPSVLAADDVEAEKWEGVLVAFENVSVVTRPYQPTESDPTVWEMRVSGPFRVQNGLTEIKDTVGDTCYGRLVGILDYFFEYKLLPRGQDDLVQGTDCPLENTVATCMDDVDNDRDGRKDCAEFTCQEVRGDACILDATIPQVQMGMFAEGLRVRLSGATVTAVDPEAMNGLVWVQQPGAATHAGIVVRFPRAPAQYPAVGNEVTVVGEVDEYFGLTRIDVTMPTDGVTVTNASGAAIAPAVVPIATLLDPAEAEPYENMLVAVENVRVVEAMPADDPMTAVREDFEWNVGTAAAKLWIGSRMLNRPSSVQADACMASITGPLDYAFGKFKIQPRTAADVVDGGTCN